jgi:hypothetical protein
VAGLAAAADPAGDRRLSRFQGEMGEIVSWYPEPGETLVHRGRVRFATGRAAKVEGMRWLRHEVGRRISRLSRRAAGLGGG